MANLRRESFEGLLEVSLAPEIPCKFYFGLIALQFFASAPLYGYMGIFLELLRIDYYNFNSGLWVISSFIIMSHFFRPISKIYSEPQYNNRHPNNKIHTNSIYVAYVLLMLSISGSVFLTDSSFLHVIVYGTFGGMYGSLTLVVLEKNAAKILAHSTQSFDGFHQYAKLISIFLMQFITFSLLNRFDPILSTHMLAAAQILPLLVCLMTKLHTYLELVEAPSRSRHRRVYDTIFEEPEEVCELQPIRLCQDTIYTRVYDEQPTVAPKQVTEAGTSRESSSLMIIASPKNIVADVHDDDNPSTLTTDNEPLSTLPTEDRPVWTKATASDSTYPPDSSELDTRSSDKNMTHFDFASLPSSNKEDIGNNTPDYSDSYTGRHLTSDMSIPMDYSEPLTPSNQTVTDISLDDDPLGVQQRYKSPASRQSMNSQAESLSLDVPAVIIKASTSKDEIKSDRNLDSKKQLDPKSSSCRELSDDKSVSVNRHLSSIEINLQSSDTNLAPQEVNQATSSVILRSLLKRGLHAEPGASSSHNKGLITYKEKRLSQQLESSKTPCFNRSLTSSFHDKRELHKPAGKVNFDEKMLSEQHHSKSSLKGQSNTSLNQKLLREQLEHARTMKTSSNRAERVPTPGIIRHCHHYRKNAANQDQDVEQKDESMEMMEIKNTNIKTDLSDEPLDEVFEKAEDTTIMAPVQALQAEDMDRINVMTPADSVFNQTTNELLPSSSAESDTIVAYGPLAISNVVLAYLLGRIMPRVQNNFILLGPNKIYLPIVISYATLSIVPLFCMFLMPYHIYRHYLPVISKEVNEAFKAPAAKSNVKATQDVDVEVIAKKLQEQCMLILFLIATGYTLSMMVARLCLLKFQQKVVRICIFIFAIGLCALCSGFWFEFYSEVVLMITGLLFGVGYGLLKSYEMQIYKMCLSSPDEWTDFESNLDVNAGIVVTALSLTASLIAYCHDLDYGFYIQFSFGAYLVVIAMWMVRFAFAWQETPPPPPQTYDCSKY